VESLVIAAGVLIVALVVCVRFILPRDVWTEVLADTIHDGLQAIWRLLFGARKVRVVGEKTRGIRTKDPNKS